MQKATILTMLDDQSIEINILFKSRSEKAMQKLIDTNPQRFVRKQEILRSYEGRKDRITCYYVGKGNYNFQNDKPL